MKHIYAILLLFSIIFTQNNPLQTATAGAFHSRSFGNHAIQNNPALLGKFGEKIVFGSVETDSLISTILDTSNTQENDSNIVVIDSLINYYSVQLIANPGSSYNYGYSARSFALSSAMVADKPDRINRIAQRYNVNLAEAESIIDIRDKARQLNFKNMFGVDDPDSANIYDVVINTSKVSIQESVKTVLNLVKMKTGSI